MARKVYKRYSEAFRIQVVREYEQDGMSVNALRKKFDVDDMGRMGGAKIDGRYVSSSLRQNC